VFQTLHCITQRPPSHLWRISEGPSTIHTSSVPTRGFQLHSQPISSWNQRYHWSSNKTLRVAIPKKRCEALGVYMNTMSEEQNLETPTVQSAHIPQ
jgi:hypothetical protein